MTPAEIDALIARLTSKAIHDRAAEWDGDAILCEQAADALAALARERDAAHDLVRCFMEDFDVLNLDDEAYDSIEKRAQQLWDVVKERDALARENAEQAQEIARLMEIALTRGNDLIAANNEVMRLRSAEAECAELRDALHQISLDAQSSMGSREDMGRIARAAFAAKEKE